MKPLDYLKRFMMITEDLNVCIKAELKIKQHRPLEQIILKPN